MVINTKKQEIKKFIKWLYRERFIILNVEMMNIQEIYDATHNGSLITEDASLNLVNKYWSDCN